MFNSYRVLKSPEAFKLCEKVLILHIQCITLKISRHNRASPSLQLTFTCNFHFHLCENVKITCFCVTSLLYNIMVYTVPVPVFYAISMVVYEKIQNSCFFFVSYVLVFKNASQPQVKKKTKKKKKKYRNNCFLTS